MFTGIVESVGRILSVHRTGNDVRVVVALADLKAQDIALGDSIAVNGTCLTVVSFDQQSFTADVSAETLSLTADKQWQVGAQVNLEKALTLQDRLGGHMVTGHVDGCGSVVEKRVSGQSLFIKLEAPKELARYIAKKGSITLDGISLTVNEVEGYRFTVNIVPHTEQWTNISTWVVGTQVNLEVDIIARYLERLVLGSESHNSAGDTSASGSSSGVSSERITSALLKEHGFGGD